MNILLSVPGISFEMAQKSEVFAAASDFFGLSSFQQSGITLDVFPKEMSGMFMPGLWGIGIPHWPMDANGTCGIAGPGLPKEELYVPKEIASDMSELCGTYDKWRPYPAQSPSKYALKVARKFATKRGKAFEHIVRFTKWETLFWVEHAPASLAHVDEAAAIALMDRIMAKAFKVARMKPAATIMAFSPYGYSGQDGFSLSNKFEAGTICGWEDIRIFLNGKPAGNEPRRP
jgi:hypothetical protein